MTMSGCAARSRASRSPEPDGNLDDVVATGLEKRLPHYRGAIPALIDDEDP